MRLLAAPTATLLQLLLLLLRLLRLLTRAACGLSVRCDARLEQKSFYEKRGFIVRGEPFVKSGLDYIVMECALDRAAVGSSSFADTHVEAEKALIRGKPAASGVVVGSADVVVLEKVRIVVCGGWYQKCWWWRRWCLAVLVVLAEGDSWWHRHFPVFFFCLTLNLFLSLACQAAVCRWLEVINGRVGRGSEYRSAAVKMGWVPSLEALEGQEAGSSPKPRGAADLPSDGCLSWADFLGIYRVNPLNVHLLFVPLLHCDLSTRRLLSERSRGWQVLGRVVGPERPRSPPPSRHGRFQHRPLHGSVRPHLGRCPGPARAPRRRRARHASL